MDLATPSFKLQPHRLPGALDRLRVRLALSFEALAGILRAVIAFWEAPFTAIAWRIVRYAEASAQYSWAPGSTNAGESKTFSTNLADHGVNYWDQEMAIALQGRSPSRIRVATPASYAYSGFVSVKQSAKGLRVGNLIEVCGPGLDPVCRSTSAMSSASSNWPSPECRSSVPSDEVSGPAYQRDAHLIKENAFKRFESTSSFQVAAQSATTPTAILRSVLTYFLDLGTLHPFLELLGNCVTTYDRSSRSGQEWALSTRRKMHNGYFVYDHGNPEVLIVKDRSCSVMGVVQMDWLAGMLTIGRYDGGILDWWMSAKVIPSLKRAAMEEGFAAGAKVIPSLKLAGIEEGFPPAAEELTSQENLWDARTLELTLASTKRGVPEEFQLQSQSFDGDRYPCSQNVRMLPAPAMPSPPTYAVKGMTEAVHTKSGDQQALDMSSSSTAGMMYKQEEEQQLLETWWDEDAVLVGVESEEMGDDFEHICDGLEEWTAIPTIADAQSTSFFSTCKSAVTSLASSFSARTTR